jgi:hypothetical protein
MADPKVAAWKKSATAQVDLFLTEIEKTHKEIQAAKSRLDKVAKAVASKCSSKSIPKEAEKEVLDYGMELIMKIKQKGVILKDYGIIDGGMTFQAPKLNFHIITQWSF